MSEKIDEIKARAFKAIGGHATILPEDVNFLLAEIERVTAERDGFAEQKQLLFVENGRLLKEKEVGMWDRNHPVWKERDRLREALGVAKDYIGDSDMCRRCNGYEGTRTHENALTEISRIEAGGDGKEYTCMDCARRDRLCQCDIPKFPGSGKE